MATDATPASTVMPVRVGLLIDHFEQPAWLYQVVQQIQQSSWGKVVVVIQNATPEQPAQGWVQRLRGMHTEYLLYNLYSRLDRAVQGGDGDAMAPRDLRDLVGDVDVLRVLPRQGKFTDEFPPDDLAKLSTYRVDVLIRMGFRILKGGILTAPRHGLWSYHHGDNFRYRGGPAAFWEVGHGATTTGCILQVLNEDLDNGRVLARAWGPTESSVVRNRNALFWRSAPLLPRKLAELAHTGQVTAEPPPAVNIYDQPLYRLPTNGQMAQLLVNLGSRFAGHLAERSLHERHWNIAYRLDSSRQPGDLSLFRFKTLPSPPGRFWADPFALRRDGRYHLFFEEYIYQERRGRICTLTLDERGQPGEARPALDLPPHHLSYPFLLEHDGQLWMIPESLGQNKVQAYRCERFPDRWVPDRVLLDDVEVADATVVEHEGRWYLFGARRATGTESFDELWVWWADHPLGPYQPCAQNPARVDVRGSRPAGSFLRRHGRLLRPGQNGSQHYGSSLILHEVDSLSPGGYTEHAVEELHPSWAPDLVGIHTLNYCPGLTVVDVLQRHTRWSPTGRRNLRLRLFG